MPKYVLVSRALLVVAATVLAVATVQGATYDVFFTEDMLSYTSNDGYDVVRLEGGRLLTREAHPMLPMWRVAISIPSDSRVGSFEIVPVEVETIEGDYWIYPASAPSRLSSAEPRKLSEPDRGIYSSFEPYPEVVGESVGEGDISGHRIATFILYPLRFTPADHKLELVTHFRIEISTEPLGEPLEIPAENALRDRIFTERVKRLVINPENVEAHTVRRDVGRLQTGTVDYLVIAESGVTSDYQPLADWKTKKGLKCEIVSTSWVYSTYSGTDNEEKIRNCIKDYYLSHGTVYVLLGGDTGYVPAREGYCDIPEQGMSGEEIYLPCDLYYSDMDGDWNAGGDPNKWGEHPADSVDMYADVYVGRVPASSSSHVSNFVDRLLIYEGSSDGSTSLPTGYLEDMLFLAEILWSDPYTDGGIAKDMIDDDYVPSRYDPITKLYESSGNLNFTSAMNALNAGQSIINHDGHANVPVLSVGPDALYNGDFDDLINAPEFGVFYTGGCYSSAIDYNTISEHWVNNSDGGGVAFVGNSRYGWGCPGYPGECVSDLYDQQFFRALFTSDLYNLGVTHADAKDYYVPDSKVDDYMRYALYELILLGDPEMPIWTETPASLIVVHNATLPTGASPFTVTVTSGGSPVVDATVCLWKGDEVHLADETNGAGVVTLSPDPTTAGTMYVTVTKHNYLPYEGSATVTAGDTEDPVVTVTAPNGGETWDIGEIYSITWTASDNVGVTSIDILLSLDGGMTFPETIATGEANDGLYDWYVDSDATIEARVKVIAHDAAGNDGEDISDSDFEIYDPQSAVATEPEVPAGVVITDANPNPFSRRTSVRFGIPKDGSVKLVVYDVSGRQAADLADGYYPAGYHSVDWVAGDAVRTGIYFLSLRYGSDEVTRKVVLSQ